MQRRALLIDGMGTLVRLEDPVPRLLAGARERFGVELSVADARGALRAEIAHYRAHMLQGADDISLAALHAACAAELARALPPLPGADQASLTALLLDALAFSPFPDARLCLTRARRAGARVVVVSNWDVSLGDVLERVGLAPLIDGVLTSAAVGAAKPDPRIFAAALGLAGCAADGCVHVGDSPAEDVAGARAAGIPAVLLDRGSGVARDLAPGVAVIGSLEELDLERTLSSGR